MSGRARLVVSEEQNVIRRVVDKTPPSEARTDRERSLAQQAVTPRVIAPLGRCRESEGRGRGGKKESDSSVNTVTAAENKVNI